jgi:Tfp pilus assembly protein PilO
VDQHQKQLAEINRIISQKDELDKRLAAVQKVARRLPTMIEAPGFLNALRSTLRLTQIIHEDIVSEKLEDQDLSRVLTKFKNQRLSKIFQAKDNKSTNKLYTEIPYVIQAHGHYHALGQFLTLVEQNPQRFMRVKYLRVRNNLLRPSMHTIQMVVETFMFNNLPRKAKSKPAERTASSAVNIPPAA